MNFFQVNLRLAFIVRSYFKTIVGIACPKSFIVAVRASDERSLGQENVLVGEG